MTNHYLGQLWSSNGVCCNVKDCDKTTFYYTFLSYKQHFKKIHVQSTNLLICKICCVSRTEASVMRKHIKQQHVKPQDSVDKYMKRKVVENKYYINPNETIPYRIVSKSARAAAEAIRKETQEKKN